VARASTWPESDRSPPASRSQISWISPIARALLKLREGDVVKLATPGGTHELEVMSVRYPAPVPAA
jgi:transcription elongation factor GreB